VFATDAFVTDAQAGVFQVELALRNRRWSCHLKLKQVTETIAELYLNGQRFEHSGRRFRPADVRQRAGILRRPGQHPEFDVALHGRCRERRNQVGVGLIVPPKRATDESGTRIEDLRRADGRGLTGPRIYAIQ
jgi:hypothetical protein